LGSLVYNELGDILAIFVSIIIILIMNIVLKNTSLVEIKQLIKIIVKR
jgi:hypothetical protein